MTHHLVEARHGLEVLHDGVEELLVRQEGIDQVQPGLYRRQADGGGHDGPSEKWAAHGRLGAVDRPDEAVFRGPRLGVRQEFELHQRPPIDYHPIAIARRIDGERDRVVGERGAEAVGRVV